MSLKYLLVLSLVCVLAPDSLGLCTPPALHLLAAFAPGSSPAPSSFSAVHAHDLYALLSAAPAADTCLSLVVFLHLHKHNVDTYQLYQFFLLIFQLAYFFLKILNLFPFDLNSIRNKDIRLTRIGKAVRTDNIKNRTNWNCMKASDSDVVSNVLLIFSYARKLSSLI